MANVVLKAKDLIDTAKTIQNSSDKIEAILNKLENVMAEVDAVWSDSNSKKYLERFNELKAEFPEFKNSVRSYGTFLNTVVDVYQKEFHDDVEESING